MLVFDAIASLPWCHEVTILYLDRVCDDLTERIDMFQETPFSTQRDVVNESQVLCVLVETNTSAMGYYGHVESINMLARFSK
jgi:DNA-binding ferritin-like protein